MKIKTKKTNTSGNDNMNYQEQENNNKVIYTRLERKIKRLMDIIAKVTVAPCIIILVMWVFLVTYYVMGRKYLGLQWMFVEEFTGYIMIFITFFAQAYAYKIDAHINVDLVVKRLTNKGRSILDLVTTVFTFLIVCYLIWRSIDWFNYGFEHHIMSSNLHIQLWPSYLTVTIGLSLLALQIALDFCLKVIELKRISLNEITKTY